METHVPYHAYPGHGLVANVIEACVLCLAVPSWNVCHENVASTVCIVARLSVLVCMCVCVCVWFENVIKIILHYHLFDTHN